MPLAKVGMHRNNHQGPKNQADRRCLASTQMEQVEHHADQGDIYKDDPPCALFSSSIPARDGIPKEEYPARETQESEHVLGQPHTYDLRTAPLIPNPAKVCIIVDEYDRQRHSQKVKPAEYGAHRFQSVTVSDNDQKRHIYA